MSIMQNVKLYADRKPIAIYLYSTRKWTMERIAGALGVSQQQISHDLRDLQPGCKSKHTKSKTNPKGSGRPKGDAALKHILAAAQASSTSIARMP
jgi:predicted ArsR family transcriptional regulator